MKTTAIQRKAMQFGGIEGWRWIRRNRRGIRRSRRKEAFDEIDETPTLVSAMERQMLEPVLREPATKSRLRDPELSTGSVHDPSASIHRLANLLNAHQVDFAKHIGRSFRFGANPS
jgi:hypothetical protein